MENRDINADRGLGQWVNERMRLLEARGAWQPNAARALARLKARREKRLLTGRPWIWAAGGISVVAVAMIALPSRGTCAQRPPGFGCAKPVEMMTQVSAPVKPVARDAAPTVVAAAARVPNFKESGSPDAPIACEIYSDYECPACAQFFEHTLPLLVEKYVKTGRMKLVHRDFPLPMHPYARLAARYANAAGELGFYDAVVSRLFLTQTEWAANGRVGEQVAQVVPPGAMMKLNEIVKSGKTLDDTVAVDYTMATRDGINQTPTLVFVYAGRREKVAPAPPFTILQSYVDQLPVK
ncbi:MAG: DsbA family protein [Acidobacteriota bacterium]|nr:DsbA family protein [Acidobacteriota bacterium]